MKKLFAGIAISLLASGPALASGMYAAVDVGQGTIKDACIGVPSCTEKGTAVRVGIGYKLPLEFLSVEASYGNLGKASATFLGIPAELKASGLQVSAIASLPVVPGAVSLFGKLGLANITTTSSLGGLSATDTNSNMAFGVGGEFTLLPVVDLRVQYEDFGKIGGANTTGANTKYKLTMISAGVTFKF